MRELMGTYVPRYVSWIFDSALWRLDAAPGARKLSLTFDDGPTPHGTFDLLRVLRRHNVQATFFLVGAQAARYPDAVRAILADGHALGNHTFHHVDAWRVSGRRLLYELQQTTRLLEDLAGEPLRWMRPPYGHLTLRMIGWCKRRQQRMVMWDLVPPDYRPGATVAEIARITLRRLRPRSIVCLHDNAHSAHVTPAMLDRCIPQLLADGWSFSGLQAG